MTSTPSYSSRQTHSNERERKEDIRVETQLLQTCKKGSEESHTTLSYGAGNRPEDSFLTPSAPPRLHHAGTSPPEPRALNSSSTLIREADQCRRATGLSTDTGASTRFSSMLSYSVSQPTEHRSEERANPHAEKESQPELTREWK